jgi:hypothetical protein
VKTAPWRVGSAALLRPRQCILVRFFGPSCPSSTRTETDPPPKAESSPQMSAQLCRVETSSSSPCVASRRRFGICGEHGAWSSPTVIDPTGENQIRTHGRSHAASDRRAARGLMSVRSERGKIGDHAELVRSSSLPSRPANLFAGRRGNDPTYYALLTEIALRSNLGGGLSTYCGIERNFAERRSNSTIGPVV